MHAGIHLLNQVAKLPVRFAVPACFEVVNFTLWVDDENLVQLNPDVAVAHGICVAVAKPTVKWI